MEEKPSTKYTERFKALEEQRDLFVDKWMDIRDFITPMSGMFAEYGDRPDQGYNDANDILDGTATRALRVLGAGMQGGLTSPARPWFRVTLYDNSLATFQPVRVWLSEVEQKMYAVFAKSNFYNSIHKVYQEEGAYGQAALIIEDDDEDTVRFTVLTCGEYYLCESHRGVVDTLYRKIWMQAKQMEEKFGYDKLPLDVKTAMDSNNPYAWFEVLHCIQPRDSYAPEKKDKKNKPWESVYIEIGGQQEILLESGYDEQPFCCPRWNTSGSMPYGTSPGHDILGDVKMLQQMAADLFEGLEKSVRPPLKATGTMKHEISHLAGMVTYSDNVTATDSIKPIFEVRLDLAGLAQTMANYQGQIREGLYNNMFLMLEQATPNMTATEVAERHQEKLLMLGPVIERQFYELLNPIIDRVFAIMFRKNMFPPVPDAIAQAAKKDPKYSELKVDYVSLLAQAQKLVTTQAIRAVTNYVTGLSQFNPQALDKFDMDAAVDKFSEAVGAPPEIIVTKDVVEKVRKQKAQAMQQQMAMQQISQSAALGKTMSETDTEGDNALTQLQRNTEPV